MHTRCRNRVLAGLVLLLLAARVTFAAEPTKVTSIEGITEYRLDNGLKVLLFPDPSKPTVTVNLTIFVGSRHEGYGEAGMAHLLEHMVFKGTPSHPNVPKALQDHGARFNGTTWLDRTNYFETLPASDENLEFALRLEADRMMNSNIKGEDLASEMSVVRNEFERGENNPSGVLRQRMMSAAFLWHNYGKSTIGNRADIERVPIQNLRRFYRKFYQPDNAMVVVAGQFEEEQALEYIEKYFGSIPRPERELDNTYTEEPAQDGERFVTLRRVGDIAVAGSLYHIPSGGHPDYPAIDVLEKILTDAPSGRLYKALVETERASEVSGSAYALHDPGVMILMAEVDKGNDPDVVLGTMLDVVEKVGDEGVTEEEVERARQSLLKQLELTAADSARSAIELSEWAAMGDWRLKFLYRDRLEQVDPKHVQEVAQKYLQRNNRTVGLYLPVEEPQRIAIPATPNLAEMIGDYKGRGDVAVGEAFDVSPENIDARTTTATLKSGIKAALIPKKTRGEAVNLRLTLRYGNVENLKGLKTATEFLPAMMRRGSKNLTRQQLQDALDKNFAQLSSSGNPGEATFSIKTKRDNLPAVLDLLRQVLREPVFAEEELEILKRGQLAGLEQQLTDPQMLAVNSVRRALRPYPADDPRYQPSIAQEIELVRALRREDLVKLYNDYLNSTHGELAIVGDFDPDETLPRIEEMLADWKSDVPFAHIVQRGDFEIKGRTTDILTPDKANATYFAGMAFPMQDSDPDYPALVIGNFIFGGGSLSSRLGDRVRQKEGLSYGVGAFLGADAIDERASISIYAICNPQNMPRVKEVILEELNLLRKEGVTSAEVEAAKKGYLQRQEVTRTDDGSLAAILAENLRAGRDMQYYARLESAINDLGPDKVTATFKKYIKPDDLVITAAGDFEAAGAGGESEPEKEEKKESKK